MEGGGAHLSRIRITFSHQIIITHFHRCIQSFWILDRVDNRSPYIRRTDGYNIPRRALIGDKVPNCFLRQLNTYRSPKTRCGRKQDLDYCHYHSLTLHLCLYDFQIGEEDWDRYSNRFRGIVSIERWGFFPFLLNHFWRMDVPLLFIIDMIDIVMGVVDGSQGGGDNEAFNGSSVRTVD